MLVKLKNYNKVICNHETAYDERAKQVINNTELENGSAILEETTNFMEIEDRSVPWFLIEGANILTRNLIIKTLISLILISIIF